MEYLIEGVAEDVRIAMDENEVSTELLQSVDTLTLNDIIRQKISDAVRTVGMAAPTSLLYDAPSFTGEITWKSDYNGSLPLPDDFMRLVVFKMDDWDVPVLAAITDESPYYLIQQSRWRGVSGNPERPVAAVVQDLELGGCRLEFYGCKGQDAVITQAKYLPLPVTERNRISFCKRLYPAVVYQAAGMTAATLGSKSAQGLIEIANTYIA